jgi:hypothetical protein
MTLTDEIRNTVTARTSRQHGLITRRQAEDDGMTRAAIRHRLRSGAWIDCGNGVYRVAGVPETPRSRLLEHVLRAGPDAVASHRSAAALLGIPGFDVGALDVTVPADGPRRTGTTIHESDRLPPHHRRTVDGIPCTSLARTLFDLCGMFGLRRMARAARALDNALARRLVTKAALWRVLDELKVQGRAGSTVLRLLLLERGGRTAAPESELERRFRDLVRAAGLPEPELQVDLGSCDHWIGRVDFLFRDARLVVELDGRLGHTELLDQEADDRRDEALTKAGFRVQRFTWHAVTVEPDEVIATLRRLVLP